MVIVRSEWLVLKLPLLCLVILPRMSEVQSGCEKDAGATGTNGDAKEALVH